MSYDKEENEARIAFLEAEIAKRDADEVTRLLPSSDVATVPDHILDAPIDNTVQVTIRQHYLLNNRTIVQVSDEPGDQKPFKTDLCHCEWTEPEAAMFAVAVLDMLASELSDTNKVSEAFDIVTLALRETVKHGKQPF